MHLHRYCSDCGAVRSSLSLRGRPLGFFERWLVHLKEILEDHPKYGKLVQAHGRLILRSLDSVPDFGDPYSMAFDAQRAIFLAAVQRFRCDLPIEFLEDAMPREPRRRRPAFIELVETANAREVGPKEGRGSR